jgi:hypothetical protein
MNQIIADIRNIWKEGLFVDEQKAFDLSPDQDIIIAYTNTEKRKI